ncbi:hypothetical protein [Humisphaera borealis]|uniref:DUF3828 domain-containing protein n=1 Tax=Humisphaera borealis TaxID=2807512 RepID=A0A7M2WV51_9BACT|nr:hypothetical protein [Humisphaera borealis]QOV89194.1 hypothetical protein IPV69_23760 [Humisphaera borealis]
MKRKCSVLAVAMFALLAISAAAVRAEDAPKDSADQVTVRAAAIAFADLLADPDFAKAKSAFVGSQEQVELAQHMHAVIHARKKLVAAVLKAMPNEKPPQGDDLTVEGLKKRMARYEVTISGDTATVGPDIKLSKTGGAWKVADIAANPNGRQVVTTLFPAMTAAMMEVIPDVEAGKFKTPKEMEQAMRPKMQAAMKALDEKMKAAATKPSK